MQADLSLPDHTALQGLDVQLHPEGTFGPTAAMPLGQLLKALQAARDSLVGLDPRLADCFVAALDGQDSSLAPRLQKGDLKDSDAIHLYETETQLERSAHIDFLQALPELLDTVPGLELRKTTHRNGWQVYAYVPGTGTLQFEFFHGKASVEFLHGKASEMMPHYYDGAPIIEMPTTSWRDQMCGAALSESGNKVAGIQVVKHAGQLYAVNGACYSQEANEGKAWALVPSRSVGRRDLLLQVLDRSIRRWHALSRRLPWPGGLGAG